MEPGAREKVDTEENSKSKLENSSGGNELYKFLVTKVAHGSLLEQTISLRTGIITSGKKRKSEREDYQPRKRRRDDSAD